MTDSGDATLLPPKRDVMLLLLQTSSVFVHLDPRGEGVLVPPWLKNQPQLTLQMGLNLAVPIVDLDVGQEALSATLSFNRRPEFCRIPWAAVWGIVGDDGRGMVWPESVPPEVAAKAPGRATTDPNSGKSARPKLRAAGGSAGGGSAGGSSAASSHTAASAEGKPKPETGSEPASVASDGAETPSVEPTAPSPTSPRRRELPPYLRIVK